MFSNEKEVTVYEGNHDIYQDVIEFQKWLAGEIDKIPKEFLSTAKISVTTHSCGCYGDYESCIEIIYTCPKTAEEIAKEKRQYKYRKKERISQLEKELAELKKRGEKE
jgi:hypothetical protein